MSAHLLPVGVPAGARLQLPRRSLQRPQDPGGAHLLRSGRRLSHLAGARLLRPRSADVCRHPHPVVIRLRDEASERPGGSAHHGRFLPDLPAAVPVPVGALHVPGGRVHRSDRLHGLAGRRRPAAGQRPVDLDQAVRVPGRRSLHGVRPHHRGQ
ncbi:hypothetical protein OJAV_G00059410 [Oryzias javanicus]|uniref:Uncharacterized protein n=1 Tax=Oryzias javanicus TaxID=123683 RepID=A0A3S2MR04_ORYJA|nr:hypothetical protein OJAV_G00059410 [Oryzias javanicus]